MPEPLFQLNQLSRSTDRPLAKMKQTELPDKNRDTHIPFNLETTVRKREKVPETGELIAEYPAKRPPGNFMIEFPENYHPGNVSMAQRKRQNHRGADQKRGNK